MPSTREQLRRVTCRPRWAVQSLGQARREVNAPAREQTRRGSLISRSTTGPDAEHESRIRGGLLFSSAPVPRQRNFPPVNRVGSTLDEGVGAALGRRRPTRRSRIARASRPSSRRTARSSLPKIIALAEQGTLRIFVWRTLPLAGAREAHEQLEAPASPGRSPWRFAEPAAFAWGGAPACSRAGLRRTILVCGGRLLPRESRRAPACDSDAETCQTSR